jgi:hypothetical protein
VVPPHEHLPLPHRHGVNQQPSERWRFPTVLCPSNHWLPDRQLKRLGCAVTAVPDGRAALAALETARYDLLQKLLD